MTKPKAGPDPKTFLVRLFCEAVTPPPATSATSWTEWYAAHPDAHGFSCELVVVTDTRTLRQILEAHVGGRMPKNVSMSSTPIRPGEVANARGDNMFVAQQFRQRALYRLEHGANGFRSAGLTGDNLERATQQGDT